MSQSTNNVKRKADSDAHTNGSGSAKKAKLDDKEVNEGDEEGTSGSAGTSYRGTAGGKQMLFNSNDLNDDDDDDDDDDDEEDEDSDIMSAALAAAGLYYVNSPFFLLLPIV